MNKIRYVEKRLLLLLVLIASLSGCVTIWALEGREINVSAIRKGASREQIESHLGRPCWWGTKLEAGDGYVYRYPPELHPAYKNQYTKGMRAMISMTPYPGWGLVFTEELTRGCLPSNPGFLVIYGADGHAVVVSSLPPGGSPKDSPWWVPPLDAPVPDP